MTRIASVSDTSYAYLATLSRLDTNGDGVLSRGERAADEKPGILKQLSEDPDARQAPKFSGGMLEFMMETRQNSPANFYPQASQPEGDDTSSDLYRNTYGQYDLDIAS